MGLMALADGSGPACAQVLADGSLRNARSGTFLRLATDAARSPAAQSAAPQPLVLERWPPYHGGAGGKLKAAARVGGGTLCLP